MSDGNHITADLVDEIAVLRARLAMLENQVESVTETERALRESRVRLRSVVAHTPIVLFAIDRDGIITLSEGKGLESLGLKPGQVVGDSVFEMYGDRPEICADLRRALAGESFTARAEVGDSAFETRYSPILNRQGEPDGCIGVATDVTHRVLAERALRSSEERFRMLAENIPGVVYLCRNDERYTMLYLNEAVQRLTGYSKTEFLEDRMSFVDLYHPDDVATVGPQVEDALAERRSFHMTYRIKHRDGHWVWVEEDGVGVFRDDELIFLEGYLSDVTQRKEAERQLQEANDRLEVRVTERTQELTRANRELSIQIAKRQATAEELRRERDLLQALMDNMPDYVFTKDLEGRFVLANAAQLSNLGADDLGQIAGKTDYDFSPTHLANAYAADDQKVIQDGEPIFNIEEEVTLPDGCRRRLLTTKLPVRDEFGEITGVLGIARDVTELLAAREEATKTRHTLAHILRVATVGEMASGLAHELNNPLSAIINFIRGCERRMDAGTLNDDTLRDILTQITAQATRASGILDTIRRHVNPKDAQHELIQLNDVAREAVSLAAIDLRDSQTTVTLDLTETLPDIQANRVQIEQVIFNLVMNAIEAMTETEPDEPHSSTNDTNTSSDSAQHQLTIQSTVIDETVELTVSDTGPGFDPDQIEKLFESFESTKAGGLGMGLAIARSIIESHGGRLWAEPPSNRTLQAPLTFSSKPNHDVADHAINEHHQGAVVRFRLPIPRGDR